MKKKDNLDGTALDTHAMNVYLYGHGDPDFPPYSYDEIKEAWEAVMPKIERVGKVFIVSTVGDIDDSGERAKELWNREKE